MKQLRKQREKKTANLKEASMGYVIQFILLIIFVIIFGWMGILWFLIAYVVVGVLLDALGIIKIKR